MQAIQAYPDEIVFEAETEFGKALHMLRARYRHKISHTEKFLDSLVYTLEEHRFFRPTRTVVLVCGPPV